MILIWLCSLSVGLNRRKLNVPRREWSSPPPHRDLWTGRNGTLSLTGFMLIFSSFKVIWPDVSDAPSELSTLLHNRGRCSRNQRVPQQTGSVKLQVELLTLFFFQSRKCFFFLSLLRVKSCQGQTSPTTGQLSQQGWVYFLLVPVLFILTQLSKETIWMLSAWSQELVQKNPWGESEALR